MFINVNEAVENQRLKVQSLTIPFTINGNATPASITFVNGLPGVLYLQTEGANSNGAITAQEAAATAYNTKLDASGVFNALLVLGETVKEVYGGTCQQIASASGAIGIANVWKAGTLGISPGGNIMLNIDSTLDLSSVTGNFLLDVKYRT